MKLFAYHSPKTLKEVVEILSTYANDAKIIAGGTDFLVRIGGQRNASQYVFGLKNIPGLFRDLTLMKSWALPQIPTASLVIT